VEIYVQTITFFFFYIFAKGISPRSDWS